MVDVRGDVLRPPHGTTPAAVKTVKAFYNNLLNIHFRDVFEKKRKKKKKKKRHF